MEFEYEVISVFIMLPMVWWYMRNNQNNIKELTNGPGKICKAFGWNRSFDMLNIMDKKTSVSIYKPSRNPEDIIATPRIGISKERNRPWRFFWKGL